MTKLDIFNKISDLGAVAVVRGDSIEQGVKTAKACYEGGIKVIEVTFTLPRADEVIATLARECGSSDMIIGAGSVLDPETARAAILAGAQFIVSPALNADTVRLCNRYGIAVIPGVFTPTEAVTAMELGVEAVKLFPADVYGPKGLKGLKAPFPNLRIMPTGGVSVDNVSEWFKAGAFAVGAGSSVTAGAAKGDYAAVTDESAKFAEAVRCAKEKTNG